MNFGLCVYLEWLRENCQACDFLVYVHKICLRFRGWLINTFSFFNKTSGILPIPETGWLFRHDVRP